MSLIRNSKLVSQSIDFTGVENGNIHPSDVDFVFEFDNKILILGEVKRRYNNIPYGQELLLTRLADKWGEGSVVLKVEHEHKDENTDIPLKGCYVTMRYFKGEWKKYDYGEQPLISFLNKIGVYFKNNKCKF